MALLYHLRHKLPSLIPACYPDSGEHVGYLGFTGLICYDKNSLFRQIFHCGNSF